MGLAYIGNSENDPFDYTVTNQLLTYMHIILLIPDAELLDVCYIDHHIYVFRYALEILKFREVGADVVIRVGFVRRIFIGTKFSAMAD
mgnify:FL=1